MRRKIVDISELKDIAEEIKKDGKKIAHCHGCFDLLHPGHVMHFKAARKYGDVLIVTITEDKFVNKGPDRPVFNENIRAENLAAIEFIDYVAINRSPRATPAIETIQPDFYVKGQDYKDLDEDFSGGIIEEKQAVEKCGGQLVFTDEIQFSSSKLINRYIDVRDDHLNDYLKRARSSFKYNAILKRFKEIENYNVLVVGDIILDEYQFVRAMGKSSKSPTLTVKKLDSELYAGGSLAVANHISNFVKNVSLFGTFGLNSGHDHREFIESHLNRNAKFEGVYLPKRPTVLKSRMVDQVFKFKLFEIIEIDDSEYDKGEKKKVLEALRRLKNHFDMIVVADFGHGMIDSDIIKELIDSNKFLCINAQTNSANRGFNLLTKYDRCDYFSIDKEEAQLATHDRYGNISDIHTTLMNSTNATMGSVTLGVHGSAVMDKNGKTSTAPALSREVVDTIGAGDAYLSVTSLLAKNGASTDEIAFVGNAVGALAVKILGNKSYIEKTALLKYLKTLLS